MGNCTGNFMGSLQGLCMDWLPLECCFCRVEVTALGPCCEGAAWVQPWSLQNWNSACRMECSGSCRILQNLKNLKSLFVRIVECRICCSRVWIECWLQNQACESLSPSLLQNCSSTCRILYAGMQARNSLIFLKLKKNCRYSDTMLKYGLRINILRQLCHSDAQQTKDVRMYIEELYSSSISCSLYNIWSEYKLNMIQHRKLPVFIQKYEQNECSLEVLCNSNQCELD